MRFLPNLKVVRLMLRIILCDLGLDIFVALCCVATYAIIDRCALNLLYGKGKAEFDRDYYTDRLVSVGILGLMPIVNVVFLGVMLWTFGDRVEAFARGIYRIAYKKRGVIIRKEKKNGKNTDCGWIFV